MWGDDNDEDLLRAIELSKRMYEEVELPRLSQQVRAPSPEPTRDDFQPGPSTSYASDPFKKPLPSTQGKGEDVQDGDLYDGLEAEGFNFKTGNVWVYPTSDKYPVRTYQRDIVEKALFTNTLVSLPTGLGKTFIAAVVMYNFYRWYPKGKIIFMAPTKPLVAQQIENCINIVGIPESDTAEMTGALTSKMRAVMWKEKKVFFLTPQCVQNDLTSNICPANAVKCVVIDEAHRALGDHAYAQVIRILNSYEVRFRVLALSATPGSDLEAVQKVLSNLMISHIEMRTEDSADITQYTHQRNLELMVVDVGPTINRIRVKFVGIATEYAKSLQTRRLLFGNIGSMARFSVLKEWESFRREGTAGFDPAQINKINADFALVHTFVHGLELLQTYGLRLLLNHMKGALTKGDAAANRLAVNDDLKSLMEEIEAVLNPIEIDTEEEDGGKKRFIYGHPKLDRLQEVVVSHFENFEKKGEPTRVIVFCEYREGVMEICEMLKNFQPLVKPVAFMGQSVGKTSKGITQKQQLEIMEKFKKGVYNTLISTSVGEEGLDIGEVDLIICFDAKNSPIRQVQRMGRTGRKRQGKIIMLVTRGKEEQKYNQGLFKKKSVGSILLNRENLASHLLEESPCMLPPGIQPQYTERKVIPVPSKPKSNQQDLRKMFQKRTAGSGAGPSKTSTAVAKPHIGKVAFLSADDFAGMKLVWDNLEDCCKFDKIPTREEFWPKSAEFVENHQAAPGNIDLATYLEFMRFKQRTHVVGNSSNTSLLTKLLTWADDRRDSDGGGFNSQLTSTQLWPTKSKKRTRNPTSDTNLANPPKKRGRPRKITPVNSPFKAKEVPAPENSLFPPNKPKSKPQFIDEDEYSPPTIQDPPKIESPPKSVFIAPLPPPPHPGPSKSADTSLKSSVGDRSSIGIVDEIIIDSDEEDDLDSSGFEHMSSQAVQQELYSELSKALKNQAPDYEEDECLFCDALFPCDSLNTFVLEKKEKDKASWQRISKSLEEALSLVPQLTKEALANYYNKPIGQSQRFVSLLPKYDEFADDEVFDGMLCGGIGDLSSLRPLSPDIQHKTRSFREGDLSDIKIKESVEMKYESKICPNPMDKVNVSSGIPSCSTPRRVLPIKEEKYQFDLDTSLDFLGLSNVEDMFVSQTSQSPVKTEQPSPLHIPKSPIKRESPLAPKKQFVTPTKHDLVQKECVTPTQSASDAPEQVSPILGSQVTRKPRVNFRFLKRPGRNSKDQDTEKQGPVCSDDVSSSSQIDASQNVFKPPENDFDLCDIDDFLRSPEEASQNKSEVEDSLKQAILKKALEAKAKTAEITFTQEISKLMESTGGELTQMMNLFDSKQKNRQSLLEKADSSSSPQLRSRSPSPNTTQEEDLNEAKCNDDGAVSEDDIFAGMDGDSYLCQISSSEFATQKQPSPPDAKGGCPSPIFLEENKPTSSNVEESVNANRLVNEIIEINEDSILSVARSPSPVMMPMQNLRKPSKLSLKKKKSEVADPVREIAVIDDGTETCRIEATPEKRLFEPEPSERSQSDLNCQLDFSMFGDEFNNSWLGSQKKEDPEDIVPSKCEDQKEVQNINSARDSEHEWDLEFAKLDAARKERMKSFEGSTSTPNKPSVSFSRFQNDRADQPTFSKGQPSKLRLGKLSRNANLGKNKPLFPSKSPMKNGWLTTGKLSVTKKSPVGKTNTNDFMGLSDFCDGSLLNVSPQPEEAKKSPVEKSNAKNVLNLSDFCDDSLLDVFGSQKSAVSAIDEPKAATEASLSVHNKVKEDNDVIVLSSSEDECVIPSKKKGSSRVLNLTSSPEEGVLPSHREPIDSPLMKKRNREALQTSSSSDSFVQKLRCTKMQKTVRPADSSDINNTLDLSKLGDKSVNSLLDDSHAVVNVKQGAKLRRQRDILSSSDEEEFVREEKRPAKTKKESKTKKTKKSKKSKKANRFILSEAEESDDNERNSSDGESTSLDELDSSFINDSQPEASQSAVDIHAKYLESVRSPAAGVGKFKIPNRLREMNMSNIYSQYPDADELEQTYADDSFCVDNEPTQYEPEMSLLEIAEARLKAERKEKRRLKKALMNGDPVPPPKRSRTLDSDESEEEIVVKKKRLKRIRVMEETMCEDVAAPVVTPPIQLGTSAVPKETEVVPGKNSEVNESDFADLAQLLDDDLDFSAIPDPTPAVEMKPPQAPPQQQQLSSRFVKKTPILQSMASGSTAKVNPQNGWKAPAPGKSSDLPKNLPSTSRQGPASNSALVYPRTSHNAPSAVQRPTTSASVAPSEFKAKSADITMKVFIVASSRQIAASPDLLRVLRVNHKITIVPHSVQDADFIISWRLGVCRIFSSDLRDKKKLEELVKKLKLSFGRPHLIVENDKVKSLAAGFQKKGKKGQAPPKEVQALQTQSPWSANVSCGNVALLRQAGVQVLFSQNFDETARFMAKLGMKETEAGHGIPEIAHNLSDEVETRLQFFCSLPSVNYAFALKLLGNYPTLSEFLSRCSTVLKISSNLGVDMNAAKRIYSVICEAHV